MASKSTTDDVSAINDLLHLEEADLAFLINSISPLPLLCSSLESGSENELDDIAGNCNRVRAHHNYLAESKTFREDGNQEEAEQEDFDDVEELVHEVMTQVACEGADLGIG